VEEETTKKLRVGQKVGWAHATTKPATIVEIREDGIYIDWGDELNPDWYYCNELRLLAFEE